MLKRLIILFIVILGISIPVFAGSQKKIFEITLEQIPPMRDLPDSKGLRLLNVSFSKPLPDSAIIDKILRNVLESAVLLDPNKDIMATAFIGDTVMSDTQYSGALTYKSDLKQIQKFVFTGIKKTDKAIPKRP